MKIWQPTQVGTRIFFRRSFTGRESCVKAPYQLLFVDWLAKVADDSIGQGADLVDILGIRSHEDRRNCALCLAEMPVEFDPGHRRHVYIGDQAGRFGEQGGCEEIGCGCESLNSMAK
jgi:hypothetical protein